MIIYSQAIPNRQRLTPLDLGRFRKHLNFFRFLDKQQDELIPMLATPAGRQLLSNVAAAVVTQLVYRHHIPVRTRPREYDPNDPPLVDVLSKLFDQKTQSLGFAQTTNATRWREEHEGRVLVVVVGCQTDTILERRVRAAIRLVSTARLSEAAIVFSGANPTYANARILDDSSAGARIINEAAQMCSVFEAELGADDIAELQLQLRIESESGETAANIVRSLEHMSGQGKELRHLVVVSSSFHLPRLGSVALNVLNTISHSFESLSLVGSELPYNGSAIRWEVDYLRSSFYEAMRIVVDGSEPGSLVRRDPH